jgi:hypothetical protein
MPPLALATLTLVITDVQKLPVDYGALRVATEAALRGSGVAVAWESEAPSGSRAQGDDEVRVILTSSYPRRRGGERVLGAVFRDPRPSRAVWIYVEDVRLVLQGGGNAPMRAPAIQELSVAVGRVLAHEVAHILAPEHPHASKGLMARAVARHVLGSEAPLDHECLAAIRVGLPAARKAAVAAGRAPGGYGLFEPGSAALH